jgi:hypothetical protein
MSAFHSNQLNELLKIHHQQQNTKRLAQCVRLRAARRALQCIWLAKQPNKKGAAGETQKGNAIACMQPQCNVNQCSFFLLLLLSVAQIVSGALFAKPQKLSATGWKFFCFIFDAVWRSPLCAMIPTGVIVFFHFRGFLIKCIAANFGRPALGKKIRLRTKSSSVFCRSESHARPRLSYPS